MNSIDRQHNPQQNRQEDLMDSFDRWEMQARLALDELGIGHAEATPLIEDARRHHAESGESPWAALGRPADFATDVAADRPAAQARRDTSGKRARDYLTEALFGLAVLAIPATVLIAVFAGSLTIPLTAAGLAGTALLIAATLAMYTPAALRAGGHPRLAPWGFALAVALAAGSAFAFSDLPRTRIGGLSVLVPLAVAVGLCWLLTRPGKAPADGDAADGHDPAGADAWFSRLRALLVGRFDVPPARADELVAEARSHVAAAGSRPQEEFPSLAVYAREVAEAEPVRQGPWWRSATAKRLFEIALPVVVLVAVVDYALDSQWWWAACGGVFVVAQAYSAWTRR